MSVRGRSKCAVLFEKVGAKCFRPSQHPACPPCIASISHPMRHWELLRHEPIAGWLQSDEQLE